ncbi:MAG: catalase [Burkholderiaceae bacterium]|nr:catalase [Burkholderiaceae bacterium]
MSVPKNPKNSNTKQAKAVDSGFGTTDSGPAGATPQGNDGSPHVLKAKAVGQLATAMPHNKAKAAEYGTDSSIKPVAGDTAKPSSPIATGSTLSENQHTDKYQDAAQPGVNAVGGGLDRVRADASGQAMTTNQGVKISDNQNSLKAGVRGPALLKDFILREKITHFDHERIPERIVHARGSGAHGYFECYKPLTELTQASIFSEAGKITPLFIRFSTVAGERGSKDTARDVRGFAIKFYTDEGNWDLVGNNMPVFFIQDAMKFPDLVHAVKPEPNNGMPQAASAHDTFWDFVSLMPESTHMLMWTMSDRAIPRSLRMMQGFGVHTFRMVNAEGASVFVKFHWNPLLGTHSLVWEEAVKISGADPDYHRRDLWEAIDSGEYPEWELCIQVFTEEQAEKFSFDVLDATKLIPEELVPLQPIGKIVLNRNPDNFFAETEQVAFCAAHVVPGIDFSNDPLLAGRIHSYADTQISRLGGPNFHELPINAPLAPVHNNQREGMHRQAIHRGRVAYEPNSLGGGCPFQAGTAGFVSFPEQIQADEVRGKPEKFAEHYNQAKLFYNSQTDTEKQHIAAAFRFELSKVTVPAIRQRVVSMLRNVSDELASATASKLGMDMPDPMPPALASAPKPEIAQSPALSLTFRAGDGGVRTRKVAIMVSDGVNAESVWMLSDALRAAGAVVRLSGPHIGSVTASDGSLIDADVSLENNPSTLFDGVIVPDSKPAGHALADNGLAKEYIRDQYRHCKTILAIGNGTTLLDAAGLSPQDDDAGLIRAKAASSTVAADYITQLAKHRHFEREQPTPKV